LKLQSIQSDLVANAADEEEHAEEAAAQYSSLLTQLEDYNAQASENLDDNNALLAQ